MIIITISLVIIIVIMVTMHDIFTSHDIVYSTNQYNISCWIELHFTICPLKTARLGRQATAPLIRLGLFKTWRDQRLVTLASHLDRPSTARALQKVAKGEMLIGMDAPWKKSWKTGTCLSVTDLGFKESLKHFRNYQYSTKTNDSNHHWLSLM